LFFDAFDFGQKCPRVENYAVPDNRELTAANNAAGQERELIGRAVNNECMTRIMPALETNNDIGTAREPIDDFTFTFIAPFLDFFSL